MAYEKLYLCRFSFENTSDMWNAEALTRAMGLELGVRGTLSFQAWMSNSDTEAFVKNLSEAGIKFKWDI